MIHLNTYATAKTLQYSYNLHGTQQTDSQETWWITSHKQFGLSLACIMVSKDFHETAYYTADLKYDTNFKDKNTFNSIKVFFSLKINNYKTNCSTFITYRVEVIPVSCK